MPLRYHLLLFVCLLLFSISVAAGDNPHQVRGVRVTNPPQIDGMLDDDVWKLAEPATDFIQRDPEEGNPASERTEIRVLYDDDAIYFGCMFYDSEPERIVARLTRRDNEIESDWGSIRIDSYHDHQTCNEFTFNPAGVKVDILEYDDGDKDDDSWDPVWDLQTKVLPNGWSAEIRIPLRILRYRNGVNDPLENVWGINFLRTISRKQESDRWAFTPKSQSGFVSRFGHLIGLQQLPAPRQLEVLPFVTSRQSYEPATSIRDRQEGFLGNAGLDLKYGIASNFTLDATVNPDFGQVEADPAVLNLTTFETFYPEKRPFFIEGTQILHFTTFGGMFGPGMFYSRRIGRAIQVDDVDLTAKGRIIDMPQHTTILGAAKLTGKTNGGLSVGVLESFTREEKATIADSMGNQSEQILEPFAHYNVIRLKQDVLENSNVGMIVTSVAKNSRAPAFTNGYDWNLRLDRNTYQLSGFLALSHTTNSENDRVTGSAGKISFEKIAAEHWLWAISTDYTSKKYNINDVGFFFSPNDFGGVAALRYKENVPGNLFRNYNVRISYHQRQIFDGANIARQFQMEGSGLFANYWGMDGGIEADFGLYDHRETRGNGLYRKPHTYNARLELGTDERQPILFEIEGQLRRDSKQQRLGSVGIGVQLKPLSWIVWEFQTQYQVERNREAWVENDDAASVFADRSTDQHDYVLRSTITFTRDLTLQIYGQIFNAKGHFENYRQLVGTSDFIAAVGSFDHEFNEQSLNTNLVLRWEYLRGSTLYLVWSQARNGSSGNYFTSAGNDFSDTFRIFPSNVLLLKMNYWLSM